MKIEFLFRSILIHKYYSADEIFDISHSGIGCDMHFDNDFRSVCVDRFKMNNRSAKIEKTQFIQILAMLKMKRPFKSITFDSHYELSSTKVMEHVDRFVERANNGEWIPNMELEPDPVSMEPGSLSPKQQWVIDEMAAGIPYFLNSVTLHKPFTRGGFGYDAAKAHGKTMNNLESIGLIIKNRFNTGGIKKYELTDAGKKMITKKQLS